MSSLLRMIIVAPIFVIVTIVLTTATAFLYSIPMVLLWNYVMTSMFNLPEVTIYQMTAFLVLALIFRYWIHITDLTDNNNLKNPVSKIDWNKFIEQINTPFRKKYEA